MEEIALLGLMYLAVGAGLFAQPAPGAAEPHDFTPLRQAQIFFRTLPLVFGWPIVLYQRFGA